VKQSSIALLLCLAVVGVVGCNNGETEESRKHRETQAEYERTRQAIGKLAEAHNAVVNWKQALSHKDPVGRIYSAELAPILIRPDGRPILFLADALDVSSTGKGYLCSFQTDVNFSRKLRLMLGCTPEQATQIIHDPDGRYAVVARVTSLGSAVPKSDEDDYEGAKGWFPAYGECLGEMNVGHNYLIDNLFESWSILDKGNNQSNATYQSADNAPKVSIDKGGTITIK
jgi:hypothetical protein